MTASHQLKSPVAIIQWCLQSVLENEEIDPKDVELVRKALIQANAMSHLIVDMLQVFRLQDTKDKGILFEPLNIGDLVDQIVGEYELVAHQRGVHLERGPMAIVPTVAASPTYLRQAIINLIDNALKYTPSGKKVVVSLSYGKDNVLELEVKDQGIGIAEAEQSRLFTEFFRGSEAQEFSREGTGLGLVLVRNIIEEFGGTVQVKSRLHHGSTFTIRLPLNPNASLSQ